MNFIPLRLRLLSVILFSITALAAADTTADPLWAKATGVFLENYTWTPGRMEILSEELDKSGKVKSSERRLLAVSLTDDNHTRTEVVFAEKDGEDVTAEEREKQEEDEESTSESDSGSDDSANGGGFFPSPFDPDLRDKVSWERSDNTSLVGDRLCRQYDVRMHWEKKRYYVGVAYLDLETGVPLRFDATIDPLPMFVKFLDVRVDYNSDPQAWYVTSVMFEGKGSIVLIEKWFRTSMVFGQYFRPSDGEQSAAHDG